VGEWQACCWAPSLRHPDSDRAASAVSAATRSCIHHSADTIHSRYFSVCFPLILVAPDVMGAPAAWRTSCLLPRAGIITDPHDFGRRSPPTQGKGYKTGSVPRVSGWPLRPVAGRREGYERSGVARLPAERWVENPALKGPCKSRFRAGRHAANLLQQGDSTVSWRSPSGPSLVAKGPSKWAGRGHPPRGVSPRGRCGRSPIWLRFDSTMKAYARLRTAGAPSHRIQEAGIQ